MPGNTALIVRIMALALRSKAKSHSASVQSRTLPWCTKPAQLKRISTGPICCAKAVTAAVSRTSRRWVSSRCPCAFEPGQAGLVDVGGDHLARPRRRTPTRTPCRCRRPMPCIVRSCPSGDCPCVSVLFLPTCGASRTCNTGYAGVSAMLYMAFWSRHPQPHRQSRVLDAPLSTVSADFRSRTRRIVCVWSKPECNGGYAKDSGPQDRLRHGDGDARVEPLRGNPSQEGRQRVGDRA